MTDVIFAGPFGGVHKKCKIIGGGESGNLKTLAILNVLNMDVFLIEKPYKGNFPLASVVQCFSLLFFVVRVWLNTLIRAPKFLHISGFYGRLVFFEYLMSMVVKFFRVELIYELRAGGADEMYQNSNLFYRYFFKSILKNSSYILCQGERYVSFAESLLGKSEAVVLFYPNFVSEDLINSYASSVKKCQEMTLIYFGRLVKEKNIFFMIDVLSNLNHVFSCKLKLIGTSHDDFKASVISYANHKGCSHNVEIVPGLEKNELYLEVMKSHFFIFPTTEPREGHSNSLTEAMALGLVPVVSNHGFNQFVVGDDNLVVNDFDSIEYAKKIESIFLSGHLDFYAKKMRERVLTKFTYKEAVQVLEKIYGSK